ncbi:MAG: tyrosine-type recombinase/integrase, partial [Sulfuricaulis sp.]|nr:tyrosine-type recombinase/integrase [Sulfuricaulis sp.]
PAEVEQFKTERRFLAKASTVGKELRVLQAILNRAVALKVITDNPISIVRAPKLLDSKPHRFYEAAELVQLYAAAGARAWIWKLLANTGLRRGEALMLRWLWITDPCLPCLPAGTAAGKGTVRVLSAEDERTKSGKWRELPLSDGAREALAGRTRDIHVLPRMAPESLSRAFHVDAGRAGLDGSLHNLRHTYISHLVRAGVALRTVQLYAGHAHYSTTEGYAYLSPGAAPEQALKLAI